MCEDTVFWDLNYAIKYKSLGTEEIRSKVLKLMETLDERLFEHPNFVWLDHAAINEILGAKYSFCFLLSIPKTREKYLVLLSLYIFWGKCVYFLILNDKIYIIKNWKENTLSSKDIQTEQN